MITTNVIAFVAVVLLYFISKCEVALAGDYCKFTQTYRVQYCEYDCCGNECCLGEIHSLGLVLGLVFGIGGAIVVVIAVICICRRRRTRGIVYRNQQNPNVVIAQTNNAMATSNMQPGVGYGYGAAGYPGPGVQQPYMPQQQQPYMPPQQQPYAPPQQQPHPQPQPQPSQMQAQGPPAYSEAMQTKQ